MSSTLLSGHTTVESVVRAELLRAMGGWRGAVEAALPIIAFLVAFRTWPVSEPDDALRPALAVAGVVMAVIVVTRLIQRETLQYAFAGVAGLAIAAGFALATGDPKAIALPGILYNAALGAVFLASILTRWPAVGFVYGAARQDLTGWRHEPGVVRLFQKITAILMANYLVRVAVQLPLYLAAAPLEIQLGVKLVLGWPMVGLSVILIGILLARGNTPLPPPSGTTPDGRSHTAATLTGPDEVS